MRARPVVRQIDPESAAAKAGLRAGDTICYVNGKELHRQKGVLALRTLLRGNAPGDEVELTVRNLQFLEKRYTTNADPNRKVILKLTQSSETLRKAKPGEEKKWFEALKAEHDIG